MQYTPVNQFVCMPVGPSAVFYCLIHRSLSLALCGPFVGVTWEGTISFRSILPILNELRHQLPIDRVRSLRHPIFFHRRIVYHCAVFCCAFTHLPVCLVCLNLVCFRVVVKMETKAFVERQREFENEQFVYRKDGLS